MTEPKTPQWAEGFDSVIHETKRDPSRLRFGFTENRDRKSIWKVAAMLAGRRRHQVKTRQLIQGDVKHVTKVFELLLLCPEKVLVGVVEDIVEREQHGFDGLVTLDPAILRLCDSAAAVGNAGAGMKDKAPRLKWEYLNKLLLE